MNIDFALGMILIHIYINSPNPLGTPLVTAGTGIVYLIFGLIQLFPKKAK